MNQTTFETDGTKLTVTRTFDATNDLVWRAFTEAALLDQWWAPKPWKSETKTMNFSEGGTRVYAMVGPNGEKHWGATQFNTITPISQFTGQDAFTDDQGNPNFDMPVSTFVNDFIPQEGKTQVMMTVKYPDEDQLKTVIQMGMKEGLSMAFDGLDEVLKSAVLN